MNKSKVEETFGKVMMWVCLCLLVILFITYASNCSRSNDRPRGADKELVTLEDSIHEFEDGM